MALRVSPFKLYKNLHANQDTSYNYSYIKQMHLDVKVLLLH